jgi:branched-chain amino acid transport system substrate-binding protein
LSGVTASYKKRYGEDFWYPIATIEVDMLARAMGVAQSSEPLKVAKALEGTRYVGDTGDLWMRAEDHQLMQPLYVATYTKAM